MTDDLTINYKQAYNGHLGFGDHPALILVDFVQAYFDESSPLYADVEAELACALKILDAARSAELPVVYTHVTYQAGGADGGVFYRKVPALEAFVAGNPMGNWATGIAPSDGELIISKQYPSAFFGTSLASTLHAMDVDTLIITGLTTSGCIRASCIDAMSHGFAPLIVADACGDRHPSPHEANLFDMNAKYGDVLESGDVLAHLQKLANAL